MSTPKKKKKKFRRYRIDWAAVKEAFTPEKKENETPEERRNTKIRKTAAIVIPILIAAILLALFVPKAITDSKLKKLGYTSDDIKAIRKQDLTTTILEKGYYSDYLSYAIRTNTLNPDYMDLYTVVSKERGLEAKDFLLYNRLLDEGYEPDQILNLFQNLTFREMTPLLVFDYQYNETPYIEDVKANREKNTNGEFTLSNSYYVPYKPVKNAVAGAKDILVNKTYLLSENDAPSDLTVLDLNTSIAGIEMSKEAAEAFNKFSIDSMNADTETLKDRFYAVLAYRSYSDQSDIYDSVLASVGGNSQDADAIAARAGASEHQTGLSVNIQSSVESEMDLKDTQAYKWAMDHCYDYGFIPRYTAGLTSITGFEEEPGHFRYLGVDTAKKVKASGLTYDEYYALYEAGWEDEAHKPSDTVMNALSSSSAPVATTAPSASPETTSTPDSAQ